MNLTLLPWVILLAVPYLFFRHDRKKTDYSWVYIALAVPSTGSNPMHPHATGHDRA